LDHEKDKKREGGQNSIKGCRPNLSKQMTEIKEKFMIAITDSIISFS